MTKRGVSTVFVFRTHLADGATSVLKLMGGNLLIFSVVSKNTLHVPSMDPYKSFLAFEAFNNYYINEPSKRILLFPITGY